MFRNKHLILAMLIAPVLAIIAWFSVDYFVAERPHAVKPGAAYELIAKPNCRRASDRCDLANEDVEVSIAVPSYTDDGFSVELTSTIAADRVAVGVADGDPTVLTRTGGDNKRWSGRVEGNVGADSRLRVAVLINEATFYAEIPVTFFFSG